MRPSLKKAERSGSPGCKVSFDKDPRKFIGGKAEGGGQ